MGLTAAFSSFICLPLPWRVIPAKVVSKDIPMLGANGQKMAVGQARDFAH